MDNVYSENVKLNEKEFKEKRTILESKMKRILITLGSKCNYRCRMCWRSTRKKDTTLPERCMEQIVRFFPYLNYIAWQGGEVFLVDYFKDIFKKIIQYPNIVQEITTNGSLITEDWVELISMSNIKLIVSIDSLNKETFAYIRRGGRLDDVIKNISLINKAREKNNKTKFESGVNIVVMRSNYKELESFVDFAQQYNFNFLNFMYLVGDLVPEEHLFVPLDTEAVDYLRESIPKIVDKAKSFGISVCYEFEPLLSDTFAITFNNPDSDCHPYGDNEAYLCRMPWTSLYINGAEEEIKVYPECICQIPIGELSKNSLEEIWNSKVMQLYRVKILNHTYNDWCNYRCVQGLVNRDFLQNR
jgi:sulfatase maturation enzyme AslB (radical SAM superfamily)